MKKMDCCVQGEGHIKSEDFKKSSSGGNLLKGWTVLANLAWCYIDHHKLECRAKRLVWNLQGHGHSEGSYNQNMTISKVSIELLNQIKCNKNWHTLTVILWLRVSVSIVRGGILPVLETDQIYLGNYFNFSTIYTYAKRFVWHHNTFLDQAIVFVKRHLASLIFWIKQSLKRKRWFVQCEKQSQR